MKTKKLLNAILVLALVLALAPAFSITADAANADVKFYAIVPDPSDRDTGSVTALTGSNLEDAVDEAKTAGYNMLVMHFPNGGTYTLDNDISADGIMLAISNGQVVVPEGVDATFGVGFEVGNGALLVETGGSVTFALADGGNDLVVIGPQGAAGWFELTDGYIIVQSVPREGATPSLDHWIPCVGSAYLQIAQVFESMGLGMVNTHVQIFGSASLAPDTYEFIYNDLIEIAPGATFTIPTGKSAELHWGASIRNFGTLIIEEEASIAFYEGEIKSSGTFTNNGVIMLHTPAEWFTSKIFLTQASNHTLGIYNTGIEIEVDWSGELFTPYEATYAPALRAGAVDRTSDTRATVRFTSYKTGTYYYIISDTPPADASDVIASGTLGGGVTCGIEATITDPTGLAAGAKTIYIVVEDDFGNLSDVLAVTIPEFRYAPVSPAPTHGFSGGSAYTLGSGKNLVHNTQKDFSLLKSVSVDGNALTPNVDYKAVSGSTVVTLLAGYLDTLSVGRHTLTVYFTDGAAAADEFEIKPWANPFGDVAEDDWFFSDVGYVYMRGLMTGTGASPMLFSPNTPLTRGMIVTILYRQEKSPDVSGLVNPFDDVAEGTYYADAVLWASANGIAEGYGDGSFRPDSNVTREQLTAMLYRYVQFLGGGFEGAWMFPLDYADRELISEWAYEAICWCSMEDVVNGKPGNLFDPLGMATRAETSAMLHRLLGTALSE